MEVMTYVLWMLLLVGSVMKNHLLLISAPKSGQAVPAARKKATLKFSTKKKNEKVIELALAVKQTQNKQIFSWIDTS
ncbi:hypothetical protein [Fictibacillus barbaricus]|uniref:Secreted protein n=1 Tax=Fictibacillus barbaricus TaxID=182136 RepID=A0ABU1U3I7_9BACL|nr:hypothetical protein [Fictibacillus barbaricus]MDR7073921.1 hypothetical protein [Fictibacillus barbaricus]